MRLGDKHTFLVVQRDPVAKKQRVRFVDALADALQDWHPTTCLSPLFRLGSPEKAFDPRLLGHYELLFVGPINPWPLLARVDPQTVLWLSLGAHNLIMGGPDLASARALIPSDTSYEHWTLEDGFVADNPTFAEPPLLDLKNLSALVETSVKISEPTAPILLRGTALEYCSLVATTLQRASICMPELLPDLQRANAEILEDIAAAAKSTNLTEVLDQARDLTNTNLGLGRLASQALSSFAPLVDGEADLKLHSLLGVGIANLALHKIRRFVELQLGQQNLPGRVEALEKDTRCPNLTGC